MFYIWQGCTLLRMFEVITLFLTDESNCIKFSNAYYGIFMLWNGIELFPIILTLISL